MGLLSLRLNMCSSQPSGGSIAGCSLTLQEARVGLWGADCQGTFIRSRHHGKSQMHTMSSSSSSWWLWVAVWLCHYKIELVKKWVKSTARHTAPMGGLNGITPLVGPNLFWRGLILQLLSRPCDSTEPCTPIEALPQSSRPLPTPPPRYSLFHSVEHGAFPLIVTMFPFTSGFYFFCSVLITYRALFPL